MNDSARSTAPPYAPVAAASDVAPSAGAQPRVPRARYRALALLTLAFLVAWVWSGWWVYQKYMLRLQLSRAIGFYMSMGMGGAQAEEGGVDPAVQMQRVTKVTEVVRNSWGVLMALAAAVLLVAALTGLISPRRGRKWLLASGFAIILATIGTMAGILVLIKMADFPQMKPAAYAVITIGQSSLGWVLVFACRRPRSSAPIQP